MTGSPEPPRLDSVPVKREDLLSQELDDQLVVLDPSSGSSHVLNSIGLAVWSLIDGTRDLDSIIQILSEATGAETRTVAADVIPFLSSLTEAGLLVIQARTP